VRAPVQMDKAGSPETRNPPFWFGLRLPAVALAKEGVLCVFAAVPSVALSLSNGAKDG